MPVNSLGQRSLYCRTGLIIGIGLCEYIALTVDSSTPPLRILTMVRGIQLGLIALAVVVVPGMRRAIQLDPAEIGHGIRTGLLWSCMFGILASASGCLIWLSGINPFHLLRFPVPHKPVDLFLLYLTGGITSPVVEEVVFRGILFAILRPFGLVIAVLASSVIFAGFHFQGASIPLIQFIGGIVFALSLERSGSILSPVIIHVLGNIALFSLSAQAIFT